MICQVYVAEGKFLQVQHNIDKVLDSKKLEGQMLSIMQTTKAKAAEDCALYMGVCIAQSVHSLSVHAIAMCICECVNYRLLLSTMTRTKQERCQMEVFPLALILLLLMV